MNSINARRLVFVLGSIFLIAGCAEGKSGYETINGPGIYTTEGGRTALVFSVGESVTRQFLDNIVIPEGKKCRTYSDSTYGGENSIFICR